ncbi:hypothetical protein [Paenibacillus arenosi]|uniref:Zinc ribbon domain-containing protein n=1 Tax=Paenibacillus arenosi TaxID=2774142 RepID=A0ABR9B5F9_9BACL|nr:hypothetical protein [Paenibacillus arenosi]MBD8501124.1 hypothetical protein [Paenibacillus arenosi]
MNVSYASGKPSISNGIVIFFLIIFFPVGLLLLALRAIKHRNFTYQKASDLNIVAGIFFFFFALCCILYLNDVSDGANPGIFVFVFISLIFFLPSLICFMASRRIKKELNTRFNLYRVFIYDQGITSIPQLALSVSMNVPRVTNELERMSYLGLLPDVRIDFITSQIIPLYKQEPRPQEQDDHEPVSESTEEEELHEQFEEIFDHAFGQGPNSSINISDGNISINVNYGSGQPSINTNQKSTPKSNKPKTIACASCGAPATLKPGQSKSCEYCYAPLTYS